MRQAVELLLPSVRWVHLSREDVNRQARSLYRATATGVFADLGDGTPAVEVPEDPEAISEIRAQLVGWETRLGAVLRRDRDRAAARAVRGPGREHGARASSGADPPRRPGALRVAQTAHPTTVRRAGAGGGLVSDQPSFVIVGTGRSGSGFISKVLRAAGVDCGHEEWWGPGNAPVFPGSTVTRPGWPCRGCTTSTDRCCTRSAIPSTSSARWWASACSRIPTHQTFRWFMYAHVPGLTGDDVQDAMRWYVEWNRRCEAHADWRYRVEDVDADLLVRITEHVGHPMSYEHADAGARGGARAPSTTGARRARVDRPPGRRAA